MHHVYVRNALVFRRKAERGKFDQRRGNFEQEVSYHAWGPILYEITHEFRFHFDVIVDVTFVVVYFASTIFFINTVKGLDNAYFP